MQRRAVAMHDVVLVLGFDRDRHAARRAEDRRKRGIIRALHAAIGKADDDHPILGRSGKAEQAIDLAKAFARLAAAEPTLAILQREIAIAGNALLIDGEAVQRLAAHRFHRIAPERRDMAKTTGHGPPSSSPKHCSAAPRAARAATRALRRRGLLSPRSRS